LPLLKFQPSYIAISPTYTSASYVAYYLAVFRPSVFMHFSLLSSLLRVYHICTFWTDKIRNTSWIKRISSRPHAVHPETIYVDKTEALWKKIYWVAVNAFQSQTWFYI